LPAQTASAGRRASRLSQFRATGPHPSTLLEVKALVSVLTLQTLSRACRYYPQDAVKPRAGRDAFVLERFSSGSDNVRSRVGPFRITEAVLELDAISGSRRCVPTE